MQNPKRNELIFLGFSIKARKILYGVNTLEESRDKKYVLLLCRSAAKNTRKDIAAMGKKLGIPVMVTVEGLLEDLVFRKNCKAAALTDKALSAAFMAQAGGQFAGLDRGEE